MGTPLVGSKQIIFQEDVDFNSTNSEAIQTKIARAALFAQDVTEYPVQFKFGGYFVSSAIVNGSERFVVTKRSQIVRYILSIGGTGATNANALNIKIYDENGAFVNDLFSSSAEPSILSPSNVANAFVGRDELNSLNYQSGNLGSSTVNIGTINITILEEGYQLVAEVVSSGSNAINADLTLILQRLE